MSTLYKFPENTHRLEISSWIGGGNAEHYYGSIVFPDDRGDHELQRPLPLDEAIRLDIKDGSRGLLQRQYKKLQTLGEELKTIRFNSEEEIREAAITYCAHQGIEWLIENTSSQANRVIVCPEYTNKERLNELADLLDKLNTNDPRNDAEWDRIDQEFFELLNQKPC